MAVTVTIGSFASIQLPGVVPVSEGPRSKPNLVVSDIFQDI